MKDVKIVYEDGTFVKECVPESQKEVIDFMKKYQTVNIIEDTDIGIIIEIGHREYTFDKEEGFCEVDAYKQLLPITNNLYTAFLILRERAGEWE